MLRVVIGLIGLGLSTWLMDGAHAAVAAPEAEVTKVIVSRPLLRKVTHLTEITGNVEALELVEIRPRVDGALIKTNFRDGAEVARGELLFELDPAPFQIELQKSDAEVKLAQARLVRARAQLTRLEVLVRQAAASREEFDTATAEKATEEAKLLIAEAAVKQANLNLQWTKVIAPISGRADRALVTPGNLVASGLPNGTLLTTIVSVDPMYGYFQVDEQTMLFLQRQMQPQANQVAIEMQLEDETGYPHQGTLDFTSNRFNLATGSLLIRGVFKNADRKLQPGMVAQARLPLPNPKEQQLIPDDAVLNFKGQKLLAVVSDQRIIVKAVTVGPVSEGLRIVISGLDANDLVVLRGVQFVHPGMTVEAVERPLTLPGVAESLLPAADIAAPGPLAR